MDFTTVANNAIIGFFALIVLGGIGYGLYRLYQYRSKQQAEKPPEQADPAHELSYRAIRNLSRILDEAEQDTARAGQLLTDAEQYAQTLVRLVQGIALKAEAMAEEADTLNQALTAIAARDPLQIAQAAGQVRDEHVRSLMLCQVRNEGYWQDTAMLISAQVGTLSQWGRGYRVFVSNLLSEVSQSKAKLAALTAARELTGTARPLLQIQASLGEAGSYLQLDRHPGLHQAARELPAINAGLMLK